MTQLAQVPFADVTFVDNPEPRCACVLLLDASGSMSGKPIAQLNAGLKQFQFSETPSAVPQVFLRADNWELYMKFCRLGRFFFVMLPTV